MKLKWLSIHSCFRSKPNSLISISSVVHFKEEMDNLDNSSFGKSTHEEHSSEEDSDSETDEEEYECVACK